MNGLTSLWAPGFPLGEVVALRAGAPVDRARFQAEVAAWRNTLAARPGGSWALHFGNTADFAAALVGGWQAGKRLLLPGEPQAGGLEWLAPLADGYVGELPVSGALSQPDPAAAPTSPCAPDPEAPAITVFTSGTTGKPIAAPKTFRQLDTEIRALHGLWGDEAGTVPVLASVPHQHFYGVLFKVLWPLCRRAPFVGDGPLLPHEIAAWLRRGPAVWVASPATLTRLAPDPSWDAVRGRLRAVFSSGGPLPLEAARACAAFLGVAVREIYGSSETGGVGWRSRTEAEQPWRPVPGVAVRIGEGGRLHLRSPWLPTPEEWPTEDLAELHADGSFALRGRADRVAKIGEKRVSLTAIEARLAVSPLVRQAQALVLPEGRVGAVVVLAEAGAAQLAREGKRRVGEALAAWVRPAVVAVAVPRRWRFVAALPENTMGKVTEEALQDLFGAPRPAREARR